MTNENLFVSPYLARIMRKLTLKTPTYPLFGFLAVDFDVANLAKM